MPKRVSQKPPIKGTDSKVSTPLTLSAELFPFSRLPSPLTVFRNFLQKRKKNSNNFRWFKNFYISALNIPTENDTNGLQCEMKYNEFHIMRINHARMFLTEGQDWIPNQSPMLSFCSMFKEMELIFQNITRRKFSYIWLRAFSGTLNTISRRNNSFKYGSQKSIRWTHFIREHEMTATDPLYWYLKPLKDISYKSPMGYIACDFLRNHSINWTEFSRNPFFEKKKKSFESNIQK